MNFLKPTKLSIALFILFTILICTPFVVMNLLGVSLSGIGILTAIPGLILFTIPIFIFQLFRINVGTSDGFGFPDPNVLGFVLMIVFYYIISSFISYAIKSEEGRKRAVKVICWVGILFIITVVIVATLVNS